MATTTFDEIYKYFYVHLTDEDESKVSTERAKEYLRGVFAEFINYVDINSTINYDSEIITTTLTLNEIQKNLLGLMMLRKHYEIQCYKWGKLTSITTDSHRISGLADVKKALKDSLDDTEIKINNILATFI